jgi:carboxypeptidase family protein
MVSKFSVATLVAIACAGLVGPPALAQSFLTGTVRDGRTSSPVADAEVGIEELRLHTRTDGTGRFLLDDISSGRYLVVVRRIGYDSLSAVVPFSGADSVHRDFVITLHAQPLPLVPVRGAAVAFGNSKLVQFEERRRFGIGHFLTPLDMEKEQERPLSDVIQRLPGLVIAHARGSHACASGGLCAFVVNARGQATLENAGAFGLNCPVAIWLDGIAVYRGNDKTTQVGAFGSPAGQRTSAPGQVTEPPFDINQINTKSVSAIEFYAGPAQIPAEYNVTQGTCGALVIWTK